METLLKIEIESLYDFALDNPEDKLRVVELMEVDAVLATRILNETGIDVFGYSVCLDNFGILHSMLRHGNPAKEAQRGQIAVTKADFLKIADIISQPDLIRLDLRETKNGAFRETLVFIKELENGFFVAKEIRRTSKKGK